MVTPTHANLSSLIAAQAAVAEQQTEAHAIAVQTAVRLRSWVAPLLDALVADITQSTGYYDNFKGAIANIEKLLDTAVDNSVANCLYRLLYVNVITVLETYLSDAFINTVVTNPSLMRRFVETTPKFQNEKITISQVFKEIEEIKNKVTSYLFDAPWHNLDRLVIPMYQATLGVELPADVGDICSAVLTRHDIVHRNGKRKDCTEIILTTNDVRKLVSTVQALVEHIDKRIAQVRADPDLITGTQDAGSSHA